MINFLLYFCEQPKEEDDRSQILPSAEFFEPPRGMMIYIVFKL
jgi:hypothetical protein